MSYEKTPGLSGEEKKLINRTMDFLSKATLRDLAVRFRDEATQKESFELGKKIREAMGEVSPAVAVMALIGMIHYMIQTSMTEETVAKILSDDWEG